MFILSGHSGIVAILNLITEYYEQNDKTYKTDIGISSITGRCIMECFICRNNPG